MALLKRLKRDRFELNSASARETATRFVEYSSVDISHFTQKGIAWEDMIMPVVVGG